MRATLAALVFPTSHLPSPSHENMLSTHPHCVNCFCHLHPPLRESFPPPSTQTAQRTTADNYITEVSLLMHPAYWTLYFYYCTDFQTKSLSRNTFIWKMEVCSMLFEHWSSLQLVSFTARIQCRCSDSRRGFTAMSSWLPMCLSCSMLIHPSQFSHLCQAVAMFLCGQHPRTVESAGSLQIWFNKAHSVALCK